MAADDLRPFVETRQVFLQAEQGLPIRPSIVAPTDDGLIVAGYSGSRAWVAKTDLLGKEAWTYYVDKPLGYDKAPWLQVRPEFNSVTPMPDGTVWLVGSTIEANTRLGLLVHLDQHGKALAARTVRPSSDLSRGAQTNLLIDCARFGDGFAIAGSTFVKSTATEGNSTRGSPRSIWKPAYWMLILDTNGHVTGEHVVPTGYERSIGGSKSSLTLLPIGSDLVVSAQTGATTELLRLGPGGQIKAQSHYENAFLSLVRPVVPDSKVQLLGTLIATDIAKSKTSFSLALITLNESLEEVERRDARIPMVSNLSYRMPDNSFVIFGADVHQIGEQYTSQAAHVDESLQVIGKLNPSRAIFSDTGKIYAATPIDSAGRFVIATLAVARGYPDGPVQIDGFPGFTRGAALAFSQIKF